MLNMYFDGGHTNSDTLTLKLPAWGRWSCDTVAASDELRHSRLWSLGSDCRLTPQIGNAGDAVLVIRRRRRCTYEASHYSKLSRTSSVSYNRMFQLRSRLCAQAMYITTPNQTKGSRTRALVDVRILAGSTSGPRMRFWGRWGDESGVLGGGGEAGNGDGAQRAVRFPPYGNPVNAHQQTHQARSSYTANQMTCGFHRNLDQRNPAGMIAGNDLVFGGIPRIGKVLVSSVPVSGITDLHLNMAVLSSP
ncbi:hypothetical protein B0H17DRAFT_1299208 [Mycena rosella]|uniref:Uncharacterized protein n=1 Tax=Mycena rosella TaxID=1033263 RepID=A0AAD7GF86_MYCRO|nr:hypothetical protein B0H17DRAFT_1299208 [Mycena rosella]